MEEGGHEQGVSHCTPMRIVRWESGLLSLCVFSFSLSLPSGDGFSAAADNAQVLQARKAR
jgi:hypothetical protein